MSTGEKRFGVATAEQLQGKELSYNNINDTDAAYELVAEFDPAGLAACAIIKHANPCGVALGATLADAYRKALACDPVSAFGGVLAFNRTLDGATAEEIAKLFTEVIIAPDADADARRILAAQKESAPADRGRLAGSARDRPHVQAPSRAASSCRRATTRMSTARDLKIVTKRQPTRKRNRGHAVRFHGRQACEVEHHRLRQGLQTAGIGAGQMSRVDSARIAAIKAREAARSRGLDGAVDQRFGGSLRCILSVP